LGALASAPSERAMSRSPSDFAGVRFTDMDDRGAWKAELLRELKAAGYEVDWGKALAWVWISLISASRLARTRRADGILAVGMSDRGGIVVLMSLATTARVAYWTHFGPTRHLNRLSH
jgi:hypothetical protein